MAEGSRTGVWPGWGGVLFFPIRILVLSLIKSLSVQGLRTLNY